MKDWKDVLAEIKPTLPKSKLPEDPRCSSCNGTGKARISCCTGDVVESEYCPKCGAHLSIETCPECSGSGYEPQ